jgi:hypothetical protein
MWRYNEFIGPEKVGNSNGLLHISGILIFPLKISLQTKSGPWG